MESDDPESVTKFADHILLGMTKPHEAAKASNHPERDENGEKDEKMPESSRTGLFPEQPVELLDIDKEVEHILSMTDAEIIAEVGGAENARKIADNCRRVFDKATLQIAIAKAIHYPQCWDTMAYPTIFDALNEMAGCVGCSECTQPGKNSDVDQRPAHPIGISLDEVTRIIQKEVIKADGIDSDYTTYDACFNAAVALKPYLSTPERESGELAKVTRIYFDRYMRDEADDAENCVCGEQQHQDALAVKEALEGE